MSQSRRIVTLDLMVSLTMILVVMGHHSLPFAPQWYSNGLHEWIYSFHMELFMLLSSVIIAVSYHPVTSAKQYLGYTARKLKKFLPAYLGIGLLVSFLTQRPSRAAIGTWLGDELHAMLLYPMQNDASFLWYIYILWFFYIAAPLVIKAPSWGKVILCAGSLLLTFVDASSFLGARLLCKYSFFFFLGLTLTDFREALIRLPLIVKIAACLPFIWWTVTFALGQRWVSSTFVGLASIPMCYCTALLINKNNTLRAILLPIARNCYAIYLLQLFIIWTLAKLSTMLPEGKYSFAIYLALSSAVTIALSIGINRALQWGIKKIGHLLNAQSKNTSFN